MRTRLNPRQAKALMPPVPSLADAPAAAPAPAGAAASRGIAALDPDTLLSFKELAARGIIGCTRVWLRKLIRRGRFPAPIQTSDYRVAWRAGDIADWLATRERGILPSRTVSAPRN